MHSFQGAERDTVVIAPGLRADDPQGRRRFANDPNLFNVMVSRARRRCVVIDSGVAGSGTAGGDLLAAYIARREVLCRLGWRVLDAFPSGFDHDSARAVIQLIAEIADA